jgi:single-strand DNA-binding protein
MSEGLNRVQLFGNLAADPELRFTQGGQAVLSLRLATNERYKDGKGEWIERTEFHSCVVWGKRGESLGNILRKGSAIYAEGSLHTSSYEKDGTKRYKTEIIVNNVILAGGGGRGGSDEHDQREQGDRPQGGGGRGGARSGQQPPRGGYGGGYGGGGAARPQGQQVPANDAGGYSQRGDANEAPGGSGDGAGYGGGTDDSDIPF